MSLPYPGEIATYIERYLKKDRMLPARTVMEVLRTQMVEDISTVVKLSAEDREKLDGITRWYFGVLPQNRSE
jgi:hypothetical protein